MLKNGCDIRGAGGEGGAWQNLTGESRSPEHESLFIKWARVLCALVSNTKCAARFLLRQGMNINVGIFLCKTPRAAHTHTQTRAQYTNTRVCTGYTNNNSQPENTWWTFKITFSRNKHMHYLCTVFIFVQGECGHVCINQCARVFLYMCQACAELLLIKAVSARQYSGPGLLISGSFWSHLPTQGGEVTQLLRLRSSTLFAEGADGLWGFLQEVYSV